MKKIAVFLAEGFEEVEALTPVDVLRRAGFECETVSISSDRMVMGSHQIPVLADRLLGSDLESYDMVVCPGGMKGSKNLRDCDEVVHLVQVFDQDPEKFVAAICAAPMVLAKAGVSKGRKVTSYPGPDLEPLFDDAQYLTDQPVVIDGHMVTSRGAGTAMEFAFALVDVLGGDSEKLRNGMMYNFLKEHLA